MRITWFAVIGLLMVIAAPAVATQGSAPNDVVAVLVKGSASAIVALVFLYTVKCFVRPGEQQQAHIKHRILRDD